MNEFLKTLNKIVSEALVAIGIDDELILASTPNKDMGDYSINLAMKLAKKLKKAPFMIAEDIKSAVDKALETNNPGISKVEVVKPGFVNLFIDDEKIKEFAKCIIEQKADFFKGQPEDKLKVLLEFVSANPTGPLSIAHGRQALVGDILADILEFAGHEVVREYYINDEGKQITLFAESMCERMKEASGVGDWQIPEGGYQGEYLKETAADMLKAGLSYEDRDAVREAAVKWNLEHIESTLKMAGVEFDNWVSQRKLQDDGEIDKAVAFLKEHGHTYEAEGAVWFKSTTFGDDKDRVLVRSTGVLTYFAADIAYHLYKLERGFKTLIDLWGPDHHGYIKRVEAALESFHAGFSDYDFKVIIIQLVKLKNQKMSKRKGTMILLKDLIDEVGKDATRFYYILRRNSSHLDFDVDLAKAKSSENPLYYIQYAHARISSVIERSQRTVDVAALADLSEKGEFNMIKKLLDFSSSVEASANQREPYVVVEYLKSLAADFHKFYENHRIINDADEKTTMARIALTKTVQQTIAAGLELLGVEAPVKM